MISKKILALMLAISVIVCALPVGSVFAANTDIFPYAVETLTFTEADFADGKTPVYMTTGFFVDKANASDSFNAYAQKEADVKDKLYISGTVTFGKVTVNITDLAVKGLSSAKYLNCWASNFAANDAEFAALLAAATDVPNMEKDEDGNIYTDGSKFTIRNFKRYVLYKNGVTLTEEEDWTTIPEGKTVDDNPIYGRTLAATSANLTIRHKTSRPSATAAFDSGVLYFPTELIANAVPVKEASGHYWALFQGLWQQHNQTAKNQKPDACCSAAQSAPGGADGPYAVFKVRDGGTYNIYAERRDRYYKDANGTKDTDSTRDIHINISGTNFNFANKESLPKDSTLGYRLMPEDNGKTITLTAGQEIVVRIMDGTGSWAGCYGFVLVPVGKTHEDLVGTVISQDNFKSAYNYNVTAKQMSLITPHAEDALVSASVTVNGKTATATEEGAYNSDKAEYNNVKRYDMNGNYIKAPTVLDALVAADAADNSYELTSYADAAGYAISLNGRPVMEADRVAVKEGDVITCVKADVTNFTPVSLGGRFQNYGSHSAEDGLAVGGVALADTPYKIVTNGNAAQYSWPVDISERDALAGCYITGYVSVVRDISEENGDESKYATSGDDSVVKIFLTVPVLHTAVKVDNGRLEFGYAEGFPTGYNEWADLDGDGELEEYKVSFTNNQFAWYDFSTLYLVNSSFVNKVAVTSTKVSDGAYQLTTNMSTPVCLVRVTKVDGVVTNTVTENTFIDFMDGDGITVNVGENETVYVWQGTSLPKGTSMKPLCAPLTR